MTNKTAQKPARPSDLIVDDLRTAIIADCNESGLPVTVINLILSDIMRTSLAAERKLLAAERRAETGAEKEAADAAARRD